MEDRDPSLDTLLMLDGETFVADAKSRCWVKFVAGRVRATAERPHGLKYSLTLHDVDGKRLLGFDNAHAVREGTGPGVRTRIEYDHQHRCERIRFYTYADAATLLADFWIEVEKILGKGANNHEDAESGDRYAGAVQRADHGHCEGRIRTGSR